jgi:hypothetical protein
VTQNPTNIAASVRQRLLNLAKARNEEFQQVLTRFALERLLYRLTLSKYADRFVLKGALLFRLWFDLEQRPTRDADFLGLGSADPKDLALIFRAVASIQPEHADGLMFKPGSVAAAEIRKEGRLSRGADHPGCLAGSRPYRSPVRHWVRGRRDSGARNEVISNAAADAGAHAARLSRCCETSLFCCP